MMTRLDLEQGQIGAPVNTAVNLLVLKNTYLVQDNPHLPSLSVSYM